MGRRVDQPAHQTPRARRPRRAWPRTRRGFLVGALCRSDRHRLPRGPRVNFRVPTRMRENRGAYDTQLTLARRWGEMLAGKWRLPAAVGPLLQVRTLVADGGVEAVTGQHECLRRKREEAAVD